MKLFGCGASITRKQGIIKEFFITIIKILLSIYFDHVTLLLNKTSNTKVLYETLYVMIREWVLGMGAIYIPDGMSVPDQP